MGLVKKASKLFEGIRRHKDELRNTDQSKQEGLGAGLKSRVGQLIAKQKILRRKATLEAEEHVTQGGERMMTMAQEVFSVHENATNQVETMRKPRHILDTQQIQIVEDEEEESESDQYNEGESDDEADESVIEDMRKLEESFKGISRKYRLINRIGEGNLAYVWETISGPLTTYRNVLNCIQS